MKNILLFSTVILLLSCAVSKEDKLLNRHKSILSQAAYSDTKTDVKMDILIEDVLDMMHESLDYTNVKKGGEYIGKYYAQNEDAIESILDEYNEKHEGNDLSSILSSVMGLTSGDKLQRAMDLVPRFTRKYKQYRFLANTVFKPLGWLNKMGLSY